MLRANRVKEKLRTGEPVYGPFVLGDERGLAACALRTHLNQHREAAQPSPAAPSET